MSITLHKTKGVNAHLTFCPRCGGDAEELILLGHRDWKDICTQCQMIHFGGSDKGECHRCKSHSFTREPLGDTERVVAVEPCKSCKEELKLFKRIGEDGGVFWTCADCRSEGAIRPSDFSKLIRESFQKKAEEAAKDGHPEAKFSADLYTAPQETVTDPDGTIRKTFVPVGVRFTKNDCPVCGPKEEVTE